MEQITSVLDVVDGVGCGFYYIFLLYDKINPKDLERYGDYSVSLPGYESENLRQEDEKMTRGDKE
ncbi:hypothetical protein [uncultured Methanospirillum sp.]|uniref:hypothetical protein n=1 Tax=uncultured Methanospirillum sp. TaxID=262503 RepID=UPI0029C64074|nr:hypothetical protein [uncultured Methanospirillum sp.]